MKSVTQVVKNLGGVGAARLFALLCTVVQFPILTRSLTPAEFGAMSGAMAAAAFVNLAGGQPFMLAFQRYPGSSSERASYQYAQTCMLCVIALVALCALVISLALRSPLPLAVAATGAGLAVQNVTTSAWLMWLRPRRYAIQMILVNFVRTVVLVGGVLIIRNAVEALIWSGLATTLVGLLSGPFLGWSLDRSARPWRAMFPWTLVSASVTITALAVSTRIALPLAASAKGAGEFAAMDALSTFTLAAVIGMVTPSIFPVVLRDWENDRQDGALRTIRTCIMVVIALTALSMLVAGLFGQQILGVLASPGFSNLGYWMASLSSVGLLACGNCAVWVHKLHLDVRRIVVVSGAAAGAHVCCLLILVPTFGATAGIASLVVASAGYCIGMFDRRVFTSLAFALVGAVCMAGLVALFAPRGAACIAAAMAVVALPSLRGRRLAAPQMSIGVR
jgi:O-antigen/teichoic acid export membrane protein